MNFPGGAQNATAKIFIRTMQDDLQSLKTKRAVFTTSNLQPNAQAPPPKKLPIIQKPVEQAEPKEPKIKIVEKIVEKPVIKEVVKEVIKEIKVPVVKEIIKEVRVPVEKIVEKIVEKPVSADKPRQLKQTIIILILIIILTTLGLGGYYLLKLPGEEIIVKPEPVQEPEPEPEPKPKLQIGLLPNIPQIVQTKTDEPLNLPLDLTYKDYNLLIFSDKKTGLVLQVSDALASLAEMVFWEKTMSQDLAWLFLDMAPPKAKFKVNNWEYPNIVIRFQDTTDLSQSLHYALIKNKLIITTSEQNMRLIINALLHES